jgi:hypothetical protein
MAKRESNDLSQLCEQLKSWRQGGGGGRGKRLPQTLWLRAVEVARVHGAERTAQATRLRSERLRQQMQHGGDHGRVVAVKNESLTQRRVRGAKSRHSAAPQDTVGAVRVEQSAGANFVAVELPSLTGSGVLVIVVEGRDGQRMRVETTSAVDLVDLVQACWRRQP